MRPDTARVARPARCRALASALVLALALAGCGPAPRAPLPTDRLVVAVRASPISWQPGPDGAPQGLEHDLLQQMAAEWKLPVVVLPVATASELAARVADGEAHVGLGAIYRPPDRAVPHGADGQPLPLQWTEGLQAIEAVVIHSSSGFRPKGWSDLAGATVAYIRATGLDEEVLKLSRAHPAVRFQAVDLPSADALIARVSHGDVDYALVSSLQAGVAHNVYLDFDVAFGAGPRLDIAWLLAGADDALKRRIDAFLARARSSGLLARLSSRYLGHEREVARLEAGAFQDRMRTQLPEYRRLFVEAQEATGIEWRLLAAIAYQESRWEPLATSETGVRGFMQLTEETARRLGVDDRLDPRASIFGAARYLRDLKDRLPSRIPEPDRTWLALAAFNIGLGHLEDARVLAQRQKLNPDIWQDVRQALPLLAMPEHYLASKLGYARGGMPVAFVDRVRGYYDILLRHEVAHPPRLRVPGHGSS